MRIKRKPHKINNFITADRIRLVGDNTENAVCSKMEGLKAQELGLDLVEISAKSDPQFVKLLIIVSFFTTRRRNKEIKSKTAKVV